MQLDLNAALNSGGLAVYNPDYGQYENYPTYSPDAQAATDDAAQAFQQSYRYENGQLAPNYGATREAAATRAYYDSSIGNLQSQLGNLDSQLNIGLQNIGNSYNKQLNRLGEQYAVAERNYKTQDANNNQNYLQTRSGVMSKTRSNANALQRLLGMNGSGNSSAAYEQAPYAAALLGTQNLQGAQQTFGQNQNALNTSWADTQRNKRNTEEDLNEWNYNQENQLRSSIAQTRAGLLDKIANATSNRDIARGASYATAMGNRATYDQQVNSLLQQITQLGSQYANPVAREANVQFAMPSLQGFSLGNNRGPSFSQPGAAGNIDPVLAPVIAERERDEYGNPLAV